MADTSKSQPIPFPFGGIDYFDAYSDGNPLGDGSSLPVTQGCLNVRGVDMTTSRRRGSGRSGLTKYLPFTPGAASPIQELAAFISSRPDPSVSSGQLALNAFDANTGAKGFDIFDSKMQSYKADRSLPSTIQFFQICWDVTTPAGNFYQVGIDSAAAQFFLQKVSSSGVIQWQIHFGSTAGTPNIPLGICVAFTIAVAVAVKSSNGFYEVWYFKTADGTAVDAVNPILSSNPSPPAGTGACGTITQSYNSIAFVGNNTTSRFAICETAGLRIVNPGTLSTVTTVAVAAGTLLQSWRVISDTSLASSNNVFYWAVQINSGGILNYVYSIPITGGSANTITHQSGISATLGNGADVAYNPAPADAPSTPVVWVVFSTTSSGTAGLYRMSPALNTIASQVNPFGNTSVATVILATPAGGLLMFQQSNSPGNRLTCFEMIAGTPLVATQINVFWQDNTTGWPAAGTLMPIYASVNFTVSPASPAAFYNAYTYLSVSGGNVYEFTSDSAWQVSNSGPLSSTAAVIFSAQQGNFLYFADGVSELYYDGLQDKILAWTASAGSLPVDNNNNTPRLICLWRNRIVLAGLPNDSSNWFMSAVGDATNFDYAPAGGPFQTQAVAGNNSIAGQVGDVINALIPFDDDKLIFGGNRSIWQMTGDPMAGGQLDLISGITGMPFGKPWCIDPAQNIYFVGSRGGVFVMVPGSQPVRISTKTIDAVLEYLDYTKIIVRLAWDDLEQGLHLFLSPITPASGVTHYWYDARNQSWWPDQFGSSNQNPLAICVLDGSVPSDRVILLGGMDGTIRKYDPTVSQDDGIVISNQVFLGPFYNVYIQEIQLTLAVNSLPVTVRVKQGPDAQTAIAAPYSWQGTFSTPGRNRSQNPMIYGNVVYFNVIGTGQMAIEQIIVRMKPGTQSRQRIF